MSTLSERLQGLLDAGRDDALLRYGLGQALLKEGDAARACEHLVQALVHDPGYSAAWKLLGKALVEQGDLDAAADAYRRGIAAASAGGDKQAAKEMSVFLKRLERQSPD